MDAYEIYHEWFRDHYGREFTATREEWKEWCKRPALSLERYDARVIDILADQEEIDRERREGWSYGD